MSDSPTLDKLVVVSPRFTRSVSLVRDAYRLDAMPATSLPRRAATCSAAWPMRRAEIPRPGHGRSPAPTAPANLRSPCSPRSS